MARENTEVANAFAELADLLELAGADRFRVLAYRRVAETLESLARDAGTLAPAELKGLPGIGQATADKIIEFHETGTMKALEDARAEVPTGVLALKDLPGLGAKKAMLLHRELGIESLDDLRSALAANKVREVKGMGKKTEENLLRALDRGSGPSKRLALGAVLVVAESMVSSLQAHRAVHGASFAGSLRRMRDTIGDVDLLASSKHPEIVMEFFCNVNGVERVIARGRSKSSVINAGMQIDLRVVAPDEFGAALQYFTGSKLHNVKVRERAVKMGFKLSEYGLFRVSDGERIAAQTEEDVYSALGMQTPLPTMREDHGEVALALSGRLPDVIRVKDLKGDLHSHSTYSDGRASIGVMAEAARAMRYSYLAITDHGPRIGGIKRLSLDDVERQAAEIARVNESHRRFVVLQGIECNIGPDGDLDFSREVLARFDVVIASVHSSMTMDRDRMTKRIVTALRHPEVNVLGHPTGRRISKREPIEFDLETVFREAAENRVALEINSAGTRLDLRDDHIRLARELGCLFAIDSDSHGPENFARIALGVATAQRAWLPASEVVNALPLRELKKFLSKS